MSASKETISDTTEFSSPSVMASTVHSPLPQVRVDLAARSDQGKVRPNNEDHYLAVDFGRFLTCLQTNLPPGIVPEKFQETGYGLLVADGMGGERAGEVASRLAIKTLLELVLQTPDWIMTQEEPEIEEVERRAAARLQHVSETIAEAGDTDSQLHGMGTTMTLAISLGAHLLLVHVGDSRAYLFRQGRLHRMTHDHTFAQHLVDAGLIPVSALAKNRFRNMLTNSLGQHEPVQAELHRIDLQDGDRLLLCSDGLTDMVDDPAIADLLSRHSTSEDAAGALLDRALEQGGKDNVTVVLAAYSIAK